MWRLPKKLVAVNKQPKQVGSWWIFHRRIKINFSPRTLFFIYVLKFHIFLTRSCEISSFEFTFLLKFLLSIKAEKVTFYSLNSWWILSWCLDAVWIIFKYYRILMRHFFNYWLIWKYGEKFTHQHINIKSVGLTITLPCGASGRDIDKRIMKELFWPNFLDRKGLGTKITKFLKMEFETKKFHFCII